jgi:streptogramin lyase
MPSPNRQLEVKRVSSSATWRLAVTAAAVLLVGAACSSKSSAAEVVAPDRLDAILLPASDINIVMGATGMQSDALSDSTTKAVESISVQDCLGAVYGAEVAVYRGSRFTAISRDQVHEPGDSPKHLVDQAAVSFASPAEALDFVTASLTKWKSCAGKTVTTTEDANATAGWQLSSPSGSAPKITTMATQAGGKGWTCQRALDAVTNVVLDVTACDKNVTDQAAQLVDKMAPRVSENESKPTPQPVSSTQTTVPFSGLFSPSNVVVDRADNLYVTDSGNHRVLKLTATTHAQTELPFTGLVNPNGVAVDTAGNVYVTDSATGRVLKLAAGTNTQTVLPFTELKAPAGICLDTQSNLYVTDYATAQVIKLAAGSNEQTSLPITGLKEPDGIQADAAGNVYVADGGNNRVLKWVPGSGATTALPFVGLSDPADVTVDKAGNVYVANHHNNRVLELSAGSNRQTELPFTGLSDPTSSAVNSTGDIYVTDSNNDRVVKLPPR